MERRPTRTTASAAPARAHDTPVADVQLLRAWQAGDAAAAERLMRRHFAAVHRFFRARRPESCDELVQRTFIECLRSADRWRGPGSFRAFVLGIARMTLLRMLRVQRREERRFEPWSHSVPAALDRELLSPSSVIAGRERAAELLAALRRIPLDSQITLELYYWEELPIEDVALALGVAPGTVKSRLARARDMLRRQMTELAGNGAAPGDDDLAKWARALRRV